MIHKPVVSKRHYIYLFVYCSLYNIHALPDCPCSLRAVVDAALAANPDARLCISAIALETLQEAVAALTAHGLTAQVTQIAVSRSRAAGSLHLLMANNPVFLIARE